ncbi:MAG: hypothetical protein ACREEV_15495 [Dongiaceae bacterium]
MIDRIVGIDFSGASAAGSAIWVAEARLDAGRVCIESCRPAADLPASHRHRDRCLPALVAYVGQMRRAIVGCDFPFSLPAPMIEAPSWRAFALAFGERFPTAEAFLEDCRRRGNGREIRRACDRESRVPFAAYNLRIYRQTFHGIRDFLAPLVRDGIAVLPMEAAKGDRPWVVETCPASTLKHADLYPPYKGTSAAARDARKRILRGLVRRGLLSPLSPSLQRLAVDNTGGDALDSMIAAAATGRAYLAGAFMQPAIAVHEHLEGRVYY